MCDQHFPQKSCENAILFVCAHGCCVLVDGLQCEHVLSKCGACPLYISNDVHLSQRIHSVRQQHCYCHRYSVTSHHLSVHHSAVLQEGLASVCPVIAPATPAHTSAPFANRDLCFIEGSCAKNTISSDRRVTTMIKKHIKFLKTSIQEGELYLQMRKLLSFKRQEPFKHFVYQR